MKIFLADIISLLFYSEYRPRKIVEFFTRELSSQFLEILFQNKRIHIGVGRGFFLKVYQI